MDILLYDRRAAVEAAAADWEPSIDAAIQRLALAGYQTIGVECEGQVQGLMLLTT